jgi:hypothetical protein
MERKTVAFVVLAFALGAGSGAGGVLLATKRPNVERTTVMMVRSLSFFPQGDPRRRPTDDPKSSDEAIPKLQAEGWEIEEIKVAGTGDGLAYVTLVRPKK